MMVERSMVTEAQKWLTQCVVACDIGLPVSGCIPVHSDDIPSHAGAGCDFLLSVMPAVRNWHGIAFGRRDHTISRNIPVCPTILVVTNRHATL